MCVNLKGLLSVEYEIIQNNIEYHAWCNQFEDKEQAKIDFIRKYGWIMKEVFCKGVCPYRESCDLVKSLNKNE